MEIVPPKVRFLPACEVTGTECAFVFLKITHDYVETDEDLAETVRSVSGDFWPPRTQNPAANWRSCFRFSTRSGRRESFRRMIMFCGRGFGNSARIQGRAGKFLPLVERGP